MRHLADSDAWKMFDSTHLQFSSDPRNVRLGLVADGFNPFGILSTTHSTWPVMLVPYNLPPWLCMKWSSLILSLVIPGPKSPGIAIDVYLQPLVEELRELWDVGVEAYDAFSKNVFQLHAALMWTVHDFPAYADVSGWSTKEKNVMDNILGTVLNLKDWTKDNYKARLDLADMGIRSELHLRRKGDDKYTIPPACFDMSTLEKDGFLQVLRDVRVPDGYASNISRRVNLKERKISGLKSHDNDILMQQFLPIALRGSLPSHVTRPLIKLACFFRKICSKTLTVSDIASAEADIVVTLCELEQIFPPCFFTAMVHLVMHLATEAKIGGPVQYRWMYPIERYLSHLKSYVRNRAAPKGCIAERYIVEECLTFCSRYMEGVETIFNRPTRKMEESTRAVSSVALGNRELTQAHRYVLFNSDNIYQFREMHKSLMEDELRRGHSRISNAIIHKHHMEKFCG
ncbi:uncharacterized protein LOC142628587 [Castanea sativa]|uniref:uncharacterized protein LOC142628587 n=1 Tax=Castanea sativa TaxID=21020 RepID=UPI003F652843